MSAAAEVAAGCRDPLNASGLERLAISIVALRDQIARRVSAKTLARTRDNAERAVRDASLDIARCQTVGACLAAGEANRALVALRAELAEVLS